MKFSVIVVALNAGDKLKQTVDSILVQTFGDYEIVVKDGGSKDRSVEQLPQDSRLHVYTEKDTGIYDAMNQAVQKAQGDYVLFLNCGDLFYDEQVLERAAAVIAKEEGEAPLVVYGDTYGAKNKVLITSPSRIDGLACYRNIPCHQSCFYAAQLCREKPYDTRYRIRADYDHFLWCYYRAKAKMVSMNSVAASYEGGGYSESKENRRRDREEHQLITKEYMTKEELRRYRTVMLATLAPVRSFLAENKLTAGLYHWIKECICHRKFRLCGAMIFWILAAVYLAGNSSPLREEVSDYLSGEGAYEMAFGQEAPSYVQSFRPKYSSLKQIGVVVDWQNGSEAADDGVALEVTDAAGNVLRQVELTAEQLQRGLYTDVDVDLKLRRGHTYELRLSSHMDAECKPVLSVCGMEYVLEENKSLSAQGPLVGTQLLTRYRYENALEWTVYVKAVFLCLLIAAAVAVGLPAERRLRRAAAVVLLVVGPLVLGQRLELLLPTNVLFPHAMKWNVGLMYLLELIVLLLTQSGSFTIVFCNIFLTVLYCANFFLHGFRGTYLKVNELSAIRTAAKVVGNYSFRFNPHMTMCICIMGVLASWGLQTGIRSRQSVSKWLLRHAVTFVPGVLLTLAAGHFLLDTDLLLDHGFDYYSGINQEYTYYFDGYLVGSMLNIKYNRIMAPEGYTVAGVQQILEDNIVQEGEGGTDISELPHIILIMNESYSDLRVNGNLELSRENLSVLHSLNENTVKGYVNASVLGGGTANSEFEVFTGCAMGFLPDSYYAYEQALTHPLNSMVSNLKNIGYTTYSMHPERASNWRRNVVYQYLGFEHQLWREDFAGAEVIHSGVSDAATFEKVEQLYENRVEGEKLFVFDLTMQNHGYYRKTNVERTVEAVNVDCDEADIYLSLIYETDRAFGELIHYFEEQDEKVIICMYGDHQPKFEENSFYEDIYQQTDGLTEEDKRLNLYKTPFVIWANYDIDEADDLNIGMSYLGVVLQKTAGVRLTPYFNFLAKQMEKYPVITVNGYEDKEGKHWNWSGDGTEFIEYRMLEYNYLFDTNTADWGY